MNELTLMQKCPIIYETRLRDQMKRSQDHNTNEAEAEAEAKARFSGLGAEILTRT